MSDLTITSGDFREKPPLQEPNEEKFVEHRKTPVVLKDGYVVESTAPSMTLKPVTLRKMELEIRQLYKNHHEVLIKALALVYLPVIVGTALLVPIAFFTGKIMLVQGILNIGMMPFHMIAAILAPALVAKFISDAYLGKKLDLWEGLGYIWDKSGTIASAAFASGVFITGAYAIIGITTGLLMALQLGGAFNAVLLITAFLAIVAATAAVGFSSIVSVLEDKAWFNATKRSITLAIPSLYGLARLIMLSTLFIIGLSVFGGIIGGIMGGIVGGIISLSASIMGIALTPGTANFIISSTFGVATKVLLGPAISAVPVLLYFDHKIRYENFSIDKLHEKESGPANMSQIPENTDL